MLYALSIGIALCGWSMLRHMGNERQRRIHALRVQVENEARSAAVAAATAAEAAKHRR